MAHEAVTSLHPYSLRGLLANPGEPSLGHLLQLPIPEQQEKYEK